jgi:hypothetical protein
MDGDDFTDEDLSYLRALANAPDGVVPADMREYAARLLREVEQELKVIRSEASMEPKIH